MARVFSQEDGNLETKSILTSRAVSFTDVDLTFQNKPGADPANNLLTDIFKKSDAAAVKQSVKNILLTNSTEKPFRPYFGGDLNSFLFDVDADYDEDEIREAVAAAITNYEPRAAVKGIDVILIPDNNTINITVKFQVISSTQIEEVNVSLTRLR